MIIFLTHFTAMLVVVAMIAIACLITASTVNRKWRKQMKRNAQRDMDAAVYLANSGR